MNLNLFDDMEGIVLHERENSLIKADVELNSGNNGIISRFPESTPLAMAYVPYQQWGEFYSSDDALENGTLFPDLKFPFEKGEKR